MRDYGETCQKVEECSYPLTCVEEEGTASKTCTCDESYYYYDSVLGTCLLDGYEIVRNLIDELPNRTEWLEKIKPKPSASETNKSRGLDSESHTKKYTTTEPTTTTTTRTERVSILNDDNESPATSKQPIFIEKPDKNDTLIIIVVTCVMFVITWVILIVSVQRLHSS